MNEIETKISPLIENMFPSVYKDEGPNLVSFIKAYYEWLEENHQLLTLESNTDFNVGDIITQENVTGTLIAFVDINILVKVDGLETFKCFNVCSELIPITSSSGGSTYILQGGTTKRLGDIFISRNLPNIRDIDKTLDLFIVKFKEKYLKNIEFDTESNKRLLVKNALDLYRSKGTSRSIDLLFRLVYGVKSEVYYPGDDLFKLSEGEWVKPEYLEIQVPNTTRAVALVGTEIKGISSGATAFVEKYIKRRIKNGAVHILYLSNIRGQFINREPIFSKNNELYADSPRVLGSLTAATIQNGSRNYEIGDIITFITSTGDYGQARVASVFEEARGIVDFILLDGGFGYSITGGITNTQILEDRTQSIISDNILTITDVSTANSVSELVISNPGSGYSNSDTITVTSLYNNASARPITNSTGSILSTVMLNHGGGFFSNTYNIVISGSGSDSVLTPIFTESYISDYYKFFETVVQKKASIVYNAASNTSAFNPGASVLFGGTTYGTIITNTEDLNSNGIFTVFISNNGIINTNTTIELVSNTQITANVANIADISAIGKIVDVSRIGTISLSNIVGVINNFDEIYQVDQFGFELGSARITFVNIGLSFAGNITVENLTGIFKLNRPFLIRNSATIGIITNVILNIAIDDRINSFISTFNPDIFSTISGTVAKVTAISGGANASYKVGTTDYPDTISINSDLLNNTALLNTSLSSLAYNLPFNPSANISSVIYSALSYVDLTVGVIKTLSNIDPGVGYTQAPIVKAYQPYVASYNYKDYIFTIADNITQFNQGELITQTYSQERINVIVDNTFIYRVGEQVYQKYTGNNQIYAQGIIQSIEFPTANTIVIRPIDGSFTVGSNLFSYISTSSSNTTSITSANVTITAKGIIQSVGLDTLNVKRIQVDTLFQTNTNIVGQDTSAIAKLVTISTNDAATEIGLNARLEGQTFGATGIITDLQIIDSGFGYSNGQVLIFTSDDGLRTGQATAIVSGSGTGSGYYRSSKGFLSSISKLHDGDYYQEYSYDIISKLPLEKYKDMFKKVMHTAGTRFFGSVLIDTDSNTQVLIAASEITIANVSPLTIQERGLEYIEDRGTQFIEIRD